MAEWSKTLPGYQLHKGRNRSISFQNAMKTPPGSPRVSKFQEFFIELEYVEFFCDHPLKNDLEAKNHKKVEENPHKY